VKNVIQILIAALLCGSVYGAPKPLIRNFLGLNGHYTFKPELYSQTCRLARNYHNMNWDVNAPGDPITIPKCINKVNWETQVYGKWAEHGFETDICLQFSRFGESNEKYRDLWRDQMEWAHDYGYAVAETFGSRDLATSIEIGNEPGNDFDDELYQKLFMAMATGIRKANPDIKIVTATTHAREADKYSKSLDVTFADQTIKTLYDVINLHVYPIKPKSNEYSPWDRSYPEDPQLDYLKIVDETIAWRDKHAKDKEIWITEFGYDSCTPHAMKQRTGWFKKLNWQGVTDQQQAQYLVRSLLCFSCRNVDRAYIYFYNDSDQASVHASSGLTRNFKPKPAFWAIKHFYETLGNYRFKQIIEENESGLHIYEFEDGKKPSKKVWVLWSARGELPGTEINHLPGKPSRAEQMPTTQQQAAAVDIETGKGFIQLDISETPTYLFYE
jgi:hypothetical protein